MFCLQQKLYDAVSPLYSYPTCEDIKRVGFQSHLPCFLKPDPTNDQVTVFNLPLEDKKLLGLTAKPWELSKIPMLFSNG